MSLDDRAIEKEIQAKGLNAPRLTPADIQAVIVSESYTILPSGKCLVCELTLRNGFTVRGEASVVSRENFDRGIGEKVARRKAEDQIWPLEVYLLQERLSVEPRVPRIISEAEPPYPVQQQVHAGSADPRLPAGRPHP